MKTFLSFILISFILCSSFVPHPIFISNTEIDYKSKDKKIEIAIKIFSDDLQEVLTKTNRSPIEIGTDREHADATQFIIEYLRQHFKIKINGKSTEFTYVNRKMIKKDFFAMWILLEVNKVNRLKSLEVTNEILISLHPTQQNIVTFRNGNSVYKKFTAYKEHSKLKLF